MVVPVFPLVVRLLPANNLRELYSIQGDPTTSVFVSPHQNLTAAASDNQGQEIVARGYVSDDMDQSEVYATTTVASRVIVQETITVQESKPPGFEKVPAGDEPRERARVAARTPFRRESRIM